MAKHWPWNLLFVVNPVVSCPPSPITHFCLDVHPITRPLSLSLRYWSNQQIFGSKMTINFVGLTIQSGDNRHKFVYSFHSCRTNCPTNETSSSKIHLHRWNKRLRSEIKEIGDRPNHQVLTGLSVCLSVMCSIIDNTAWFVGPNSAEIYQSIYHGLF